MIHGVRSGKSRITLPGWLPAVCRMRSTGLMQVTDHSSSKSVSARSKPNSTSHSDISGSAGLPSLFWLQHEPKATFAVGGIDCDKASEDFGQESVERLSDRGRR